MSNLSQSALFCFVVLFVCNLAQADYGAGTTGRPYAGGPSRGLGCGGYSYPDCAVATGATTEEACAEAYMDLFNAVDLQVDIECDNFCESRGCERGGWESTTAPEYTPVILAPGYDKPWPSGAACTACWTVKCHCIDS